MLVQLHVKNLALIEEADISFGKGLTILSGETGAGKSVLLESINLALGGRANRDIIRHGKDYALIEMTFEPEKSELLDWLKGKDIYPEDGQIIISRKITADRSPIRINGETYAASAAKEIGEALLDIHGQNEHQKLLKKNDQLLLVDVFGGDEISKLKKKIAASYSEYRKVLAEEAKPGMDETERLRELDLLEYEINEIEAAGIKEGEEEELEAEYTRLSNGKKIIEVLNDAYSRIGTELDTAAGSLMDEAAGAVSEIASLDDALNAIYEQLLVLESEVAEAAGRISDYISGFTFDEETLLSITQRLDLIRNLERKYGNTCEKINEHLQKDKSRREELLLMDDRKEELAKEKKVLEDLLTADSASLTKLRKEAASVLEQRITENLSGLNFLQAEFKIRLDEKKEFSSTGLDEAQILISMNKGEELKPLEKVASGGELSRIMLAIKSVIAAGDMSETLIFDEIDAGISGITASCVAGKLRQISDGRQVICISHLPQIVAAAQDHFLIEKHEEGESTVTTVEKLGSEGQINEIARLLGGNNITEVTLSSAKELKDSFRSCKTCFSSL